MEMDLQKCQHCGKPFQSPTDAEAVCECSKSTLQQPKQPEGDLLPCPKCGDQKHAKAAWIGKTEKCLCGCEFKYSLVLTTTAAEPENATSWLQRQGKILWQKSHYVWNQQVRPWLNRRWQYFREHTIPKTIASSKSGCEWTFKSCKSRYEQLAGWLRTMPASPSHCSPTSYNAPEPPGMHSGLNQVNIVPSRTAGANSDSDISQRSLSTADANSDQDKPANLPPELLSDTAETQRSADWAEIVDVIPHNFMKRTTAPPLKKNRNSALLAILFTTIVVAMLITTYTVWERAKTRQRLHDIRESDDEIEIRYRAMHDLAFDAYLRRNNFYNIR